MNKPEKDEKIDEAGNVTAFDHLLIRDKESGQVILNRRETKGGRECLTK